MAALQPPLSYTPPTAPTQWTCTASCTGPAVKSQGGSCPGTSQKILVLSSWRLRGQQNIFNEKKFIRLKPSTVPGC